MASYQCYNEMTLNETLFKDLLYYSFPRATNEGTETQRD